MARATEGEKDCSRFLSSPSPECERVKQVFLAEVLAHPVLSSDSYVVAFLEADEIDALQPNHLHALHLQDFGHSSPPSTSRLSSSGMPPPPRTPLTAAAAAVAAAAYSAKYLNTHQHAPDTSNLLLGMAGLAVSSSSLAHSHTGLYHVPFANGPQVAPKAPVAPQ